MGRHRNSKGRMEPDTKFLVGILALAAIVVAALALFCLLGWMDAGKVASNTIQARLEARHSKVVVQDKPQPLPVPQEQPYVPLMLQTDPQWSDVPYGQDTIGESGCGLVAATMALDYLAKVYKVPSDVAEEVGDACLVPASNGMGLDNDMAAFGRYFDEQYGLKTSERYYDAQNALESLKAGNLVFASTTGPIGSTAYPDGHIVLLWKYVDGLVWLRDPASGENSSVPISDAEFVNGIMWSYFYSIGSR